MKTLGIRVKPDAVIWAVFDSTDNSIVNVENIKIPKALPTPESLKFIRNSILDILREYEIEQAGIRIIESNSKTISIPRIEIEGVIQEAFASSSLKKYYCGQISTIAAKLGIVRADFKHYIDNTKKQDLVDNWVDFNKEEREAILTALGAKNA